MLAFIHHAHKMYLKKYYTQLIDIKDLKTQQLDFFENQLKEYKKTLWGRENLKKVNSFEDFRSVVATSRYKDWENLIQTQREDSKDHICRNT